MNTGHWSIVRCGLATYRGSHGSTCWLPALGLHSHLVPEPHFDRNHDRALRYGAPASVSRTRVGRQGKEIMSPQLSDESGHSWTAATRRQLERRLPWENLLP